MKNQKRNSYCAIFVSGLALFILGFRATGCVRHQPTIASTADLIELDEQFITDHHGYIVDDHYLILEVHGRSDAYRVIPASQSWGSRANGVLIDLIVVDLRDGTYERVFGRPTSITSWRGFVDGKEIKLEGHLVIEAHTTDTNGDDSLDYRDEKHLLAYDFKMKKLSDLAPAGYRYAQSFPRAGKLILSLRSRDFGHAAIYEYDPSTRQGRFVAKRIEISSDE